MACGETVTVTFTAYDQCSNNNTAVSTITVIDNTAPNITCPPAANNVADEDLCLIQNLVVSAPVATDNCGIPVITWEKSGDTAGTGDGTVDGPFNVGVTTVTYTATDDCGNTATCVQEITIVDEQPPDVINCPADIAIFADYGKNYASGVEPGLPDYTDNCGTSGLKLSWALEPPADWAAEYDPSELSGIGYYPDPNNFYLGVTKITYTIADAKGNKVDCSFTVTIDSKPLIECPDDITVNVDPGECGANLDPGIPVLIQGAQPVTWSWSITGPGGSVENNGSFTGSISNPGPPSIGLYDFNVGTSTIKWTAANSAGTDNCSQTITVIDNEKPVISPLGSFGWCVENLSMATYDGGDLLLYYPDYPSADYYLFRSGDPSLDLDVRALFR